jgi:hypothetical protein
MVLSIFICWDIRGRLQKYILLHLRPVKINKKI